MISLTSMRASRAAVTLLAKTADSLSHPFHQAGSLFTNKHNDDEANVFSPVFHPTSVLVPAKPITFSRCLHTLVRHSSFSTNVASTTSTTAIATKGIHISHSNTSRKSYIYKTVERPILRSGETLYSIRIGDGDESTPAISLFDRSLTNEGFLVYLGVFSEDDAVIDDIQISSYNSSTFSPYFKQSEHGTYLTPETVLNCTFLSDNSCNMTCVMLVKSVEDEVIGRCYLSIDHISTLQQESVKLPIVNDNDTIVGTLDCSILDVHGLEDPGLDVTQRHACAMPDRPLEIGHRGCGVTHTDRELFTSIPCLPENTIASLMIAHQHGADMVETDVVVTQDLKPVIHHDLEIDIHSGTLPISHVTSNVLESLPDPKLDITPDQMTEQLFGEGSSGVQRCVESLVTNNVNMFPSLRDLCEKLPQELGLMLEVKANLPETGKAPVPYHDKEVYVDAILHDLFAHAGERSILLCSFCPTTCIMFRNKQNRYPVVLVCCGSTDTYSDYADKRLQSLQTSAKFALSENLHGLSIFSGLMQENMEETISSLRNAGLATYTWGFHSCDKEFRQQSRDLNINGIIYDRIYEGGLPKRDFDTTNGHMKL